MQTVEQAHRVVERGFPALKLRCGRDDWREDVAVVAAVRAELGERLELMVDCNQGWRMPWDIRQPGGYREAVSVAAALNELGVYWMEEPVHRADFDSMAALRRKSLTMIAGGEMAREEHELEMLIKQRCVDVLQPDAVLTGGITGLQRLVAAAEQAGIVFSPHTWGNGVGLVANAHLAAGCAETPYLEYPFDPPQWTEERRDYLLVEPITVDADGWLVLPTGPGLGVELDEDQLAATRIR